MAQSDLVVHIGGNTDDFTQSIENARKSITELGQRAVNELNDISAQFRKTADGPAPLMKKLREIRKQMEQLATSAEGQTAEGKKLYSEMSKTAQQYDAQLRQIQRDSRAVGEATEETVQKNISATEMLSQKVAELRDKMLEMATVGQDGSPMFKEMAKQLAELEKAQERAGRAVSDSVQKEKGIDLRGIGQEMADKVGLGKAFGAVAAGVNPATIAITAVGTTMIAAGKAAAEFETHLNSLQALTGLTDDEMKNVSEKAIEMSKSFKSSASDIVDAMKLIGSQAPELLSDADALMAVTKAANVLSEAAEIDVTTAGSAITTVMNQMGVAATEAENIINTFAAASQQGTADVSDLITAFEKTGTAASLAGMSYIELTAAIEATRGKFGDAATEGTSLQNMILALEKQANDNFKPSVVGMSKALENLAAQSLTTEEIVKMFGQSGMAAAQGLIENRAKFDELSESIQGTSTAYEQMEINQKGLEGSITKLKSAWDAFLLTLGESAIMQGIADTIVMMVNGIMEIIDVISDVCNSFNAFGEVSVENISPLKYQLDLVIGTIKALGTIVEIVIRLVAKVFNGLIDAVKFVKDGIVYQWEQVKKNFGDTAFVKWLVNAFNKICDAAANMCAAIKKYWNKLKEFLGMKVDANVEGKVTHTDVNVTENKTNNSVNTTATSTDKKSKKTGTKSTKTEKVDYLVSVDDKTLETAEKKLQAWQSKQKTIKVDDVEGLKECSDQIKKWQDEVEKRKLIIQFGNEIFDNLNTLQNQLKELENIKSLTLDIDLSDEAALNELSEFINEVNSLNGSSINIDLEVNPGKLKQIDKDIEELKNKILIESIKIGFKPEIEKGSKTDIENEIKKLEDVKKILFQTNADPDTIKKVTDEVKALKNQLEAEDIRLGITPKIEAGSLNEIKKRIKEKEEEITLALNTDISPESMRKLQDELDKLRKEEKEKSVEIGVTRNQATISKKEESWYRGSVEDKKQSLSNAQSMVSEIQENYRLKLIGKDEVESQLSEINSQLESLNLKPITLTFNDDGTLTTAAENLERYKEKMDGVAQITGSVGNVFGSLGSAISGTTGEVMNFASQSINAVAQIIPQIVSLIAAKEAEALASGTASGAAMPFPANIAAIAGIIATIAGVFASLPKFESGGIVGGSSFTGDKLLARVNSGEMILNKTQQRNLYNSMNYAEVGQPMANTLRGDVTFNISGSSLKGCLKNYDSKMSKIK